MTKTKGLRHFYISDPVFKTKTLFVIGGKESDFKALMESKFNVDYQARVEDEFNVGTVLSLDAKPYRVLWTSHLPVTATAIGQLAHEVAHLVFDICEDRGISASAHMLDHSRGDEPFAYLSEYYLVEALNKARAR